MGILKPQQQQSPDFGLKIPFCNDVWIIKDWDYYKNADEAHQHAWDSRSGKTNHNMDFLLIDNTVIREELKYCMYKTYSSGIKLRTFAEKFDYLKHFINFFNTHDYKTITTTDISEFEWYIAKDAGIKTVIQNGFRPSLKEEKMIATTKKNRPISFLETCISMVQDYYDSLSDEDIYSRDLWQSKDLPTVKSCESYNVKLDFSGIKNDSFKQTLKEYCKNRMTVITFETLLAQHRAICVFYEWLDNNFPDITYLEELDRDIMEDYFVWLRTESGFSQHLLNETIRKLKSFFEICDLLELPHVPEFDLILNTDYAFKTKKEPKYFTDEELKSVIGIIPKMPALYGKILFCLVTLGCRVSEVLKLKISQVKQYPDGTHYLILYQYKTKAEYEKAIPDSTAKVILSEIKRSKKILGDNAIYVFIGEKNSTISESTLCTNINKVMIANQIRDRNGEILHCNPHRLRSTLATSLIKSGTDVKAVGKLLGQKCIQSLSHYAAITNDTVKEQLKDRIAKDELLISNIGKFDDKVLSEYESPIPLCNGWCVKSPTLGQCKKANHCLECNMFVPTLSYLAYYERQLHEIEATIAVAKSNNMEVLLHKSMKTKESLKNIISKIMERRNANE